MGNCNIIEWGGGPLGPEAMFFKPNSGAEFEIWAWDYHDWDSEHWPMPYPLVRDRSGTRRTTWARVTAHPTRASLAVDMATAWETLSVSAAEISLSFSHIFFERKYGEKISFEINPFFSYFL